ncbi:imm11 family protein [Flavobacterium terrisoli]|uniref:imm11 family protein n=1 Tax=Flavobacterium terrisoli TaxID=3242195 RepID=UPI0025431D73|nr:DUF1629 domain-containing protein [Flavobacterium buctense]
MKFYYIRHSLDKNILGENPQVKDFIYNCDVSNNPLFIDKFHFERIDVNPIVVNPVLHHESNLTDLIDANGDIGFTYTKLISNKLKSILESKKASGVQFFQCSVFKDGIEYKDYWLLSVYEFNMNFIDFSSSEITVGIKKSGGGTERKNVKVQTLEEFLKVQENHKQKMEIVSINKVHLVDDIKDDLFFIKTAGKYVVSDKLKSEIENVGCTGIEFQPVEFSINEWLQGGEREKVYGKI